MGSQQSQLSKKHDFPPQPQDKPRPDNVAHSSSQALATNVPSATALSNGASITTTRPSRSSSPPRSEIQSRSQLSSPSASSLFPTLTFGLSSSAAGLLYGSVTGILRSRNPVIYAVTSCIQWGLAGTTFHGLRSLAFNPSVAGEIADAREGRLVGTMVAGIAAGGVAGAVKGLGRVMPFALVGGFGGFGGQWLRERRSVEDENEVKGDGKKGWLERLGRSGWSPMKMLSDEEYADILRTKLLKVETEIAVLEDDIKRIREDNDGKGDG